MGTNKSAYVGLWYGGAGYSVGEWATGAEVFDSLEHAKNVIASRFVGRRWLSADATTHAAEWAEPTTDDGTHAYRGARLDVRDTPGVVLGTELLLVPLDAARLEDLERDGPYACSHRLTIGPRGGVQVTRL